MVACITQPERILRIPEVAHRLGMSRSWIYDRLNPRSKRYDVTFPKPIKIGANATGWLESSIDAWIKTLSLPTLQCNKES